MSDLKHRWQLIPQTNPPSWLLELMEERLFSPSARFAAQLLWQRGLQDADSVLAFLDPAHYQPASPWAFGIEMEGAVDRLQCALDNHETVYIWGDFDADGITATAVLWEGLGQFFAQNETLYYFIPNRFTDSHGLSISGLEQIAAQGARLIVTCDTGSSDTVGLEHAKALGIDVIITDHHTLPAERPDAVAFINSRSLPTAHPLSQLSGVAVAFKLIEALYETLPQVSVAPLETLLDLVAIGLIADLVQLTGDCRYLAQRGLAQLKQQMTQPTRPGVAKLLKLCQKTGNRPSDVSFGLGPRINALSRIQGEARDGVELLTSQDPVRAEALAQSAEWMNTCRKEVQQQMLAEAEAKLALIDLESTPVIVLSNPQWSVGMLGLVAGQLAQSYGRPTILLSEFTADGEQIARGSARSARGIDLYGLLQQQAHLLYRFGGHPFTVGLSLPVENLPLFAASVHQDMRQRFGALPPSALKIDLAINLSEIVQDQGAALFHALQQLEPYGMGNPTPRLLVRNCRLEQRRSDFSQTVAGRKVKYKKVQFMLRDETTAVTFPGIWWGHDAEDLPEGCCDVVLELEYGRLSRRTSEYHARLVAVRSAELPGEILSNGKPSQDWLLDWRESAADLAERDAVRLEQCPTHWNDLDQQAQAATVTEQKLALAYPILDTVDPTLRWQQLVGLAKYSARVGCLMSFKEVQERLILSEQSLALGLEALSAVGFRIQVEASSFRAETMLDNRKSESSEDAIQRFVSAVAEDQFQQAYFQHAPVQQLQQTLESRILG